MPKKILSVVESAYRAITEEQDDTIIWINSAMKKAGGDITILLKGNAVCYSLAHQKAEALSFGNWHQSNPADISEDMRRLMAQGTKVFYVQEDALDRGLQEKDILPGFNAISRFDLGRIYAEFDTVWHW